MSCSVIKPQKTSYNLKKRNQQPTNQQTDGPTDQPMDQQGGLQSCV